jgi:hypothetical protein
MTRAFGGCARFASFARELNPQQFAAVTAPLALKAAKE